MTRWVGGPGGWFGVRVALSLCRSDVAPVCCVSVLTALFEFFVILGRGAVFLRVLGNAHSARPVFVGSSASESKIFKNQKLHFPLPFPFSPFLPFLPFLPFPLSLFLFSFSFRFFFAFFLIHLVWLKFTMTRQCTMYTHTQLPSVPQS